MYSHTFSISVFIVFYEDHIYSVFMGAFIVNPNAFVILYDHTHKHFLKHYTNSHETIYTYIDNRPEVCVQVSIGSHSVVVNLITFIT